jgi:hypothetical protein
MAKQTKKAFVEEQIQAVFFYVDNHAGDSIDLLSECAACCEEIERIILKAIAFGKKSAKP